MADPGPAALGCALSLPPGQQLSCIFTNAANFAVSGSGVVLQRPLIVRAAKRLRCSTRRRTSTRKGHPLGVFHPQSHSIVFHVPVSRDGCDVDWTIIRVPLELLIFIAGCQMRFRESSTEFGYTGTSIASSILVKDTQGSMICLLIKLSTLSFMDFPPDGLNVRGITSLSRQRPATTAFLACRACASVRQGEASKNWTTPKRRKILSPVGSTYSVASLGSLAHAFPQRS